MNKLQEDEKDSDFINHKVEYDLDNTCISTWFYY